MALLSTVIGRGVAASRPASGSAEVQGTARFAVSTTSERVDHVGLSATENIDTTADRDLQLEVAWGAAHANNTIQMRSLIVEQLS